MNGVSLLTAIRWAGVEAQNWGLPFVYNTRFLMLRYRVR